VQMKQFLDSLFSFSSFFLCDFYKNNINFSGTEKSGPMALGEAILGTHGNYPHEERESRFEREYG
jgi:hypothetical protein